MTGTEAGYEMLDPQKTPHTLSYQVSFGVSFVNICDKNIFQHKKTLSGKRHNHKHWSIIAWYPQTWMVNCRWCICQMSPLNDWWFNGLIQNVFPISDLTVIMAVIVMIMYDLLIEVTDTRWGCGYPTHGVLVSTNQSDIQENLIS